MAKPKNNLLKDIPEPLTESETVIHLLTQINTNLQELVKASKDIDYKLWAYAKKDGIIK